MIKKYESEKNNGKDKRVGKSTIIGRGCIEK